MKTVKLLFLADVCGEAALSALCRALPDLRRETKANLVIVNAENCADDNGAHPALCEALFDAGADVLTGGNHTLKKPEMRDWLDDHPRALRPINLTHPTEGEGSVIVEAGGLRVLVANFLGQAFLSGTDNPFEAADRLLEKACGDYDVAVCDFHAEASAEKGAFARDFDGRFSVVVGTHTHVPTADLQILPHSTGFVTDLGMCGARESVLGVKIEESIRRFRTGEPLRYRPATGEVVLMGALFDVAEDGRCLTAERIERRV
ncbi:MAG: YmdB family metallophosphoesterase [Clostridia bacterium]|nr:YmdB family metallophosphoesterase [Clostridia bacterium]